MDSYDSHIACEESLGAFPVLFKSVVYYGRHLALNIIKCVHLHCSSL